jgi:GH24 family phage-related lysozyme (muramidase)
MAGVDWNFIHKTEGYWLTGYVPNVPNKNGRIASGVTVIFGYDIGQHSKKEIMALAISAALKEKLYPFCEKTGANAVQALEQDYLEGVNWKLHQNFPKHVDELARHNVLAAVHAQYAGPAQLKVTPPRGVHETGRLGTFRDPKAGEKVTQFVASEAWHPGLTLTKAEGDELAAAVQDQYYANLERNFNKACKGAGKHLSLLPADVQTALMSLAWQLGPSFWAGKGPRKEVFDAAARGDWADAVDTLKAAPFPGPRDSTRRREEAELIARGMGIDFKIMGPKERAYHMLELIEARGSFGNIG